MNRKRSYDLEAFKKLFSNSASRHITQVAHKNAAEIGYVTEEAIEEVVNKLSVKNFYKSMQSHHNKKLWQDVYKLEDEGNSLYIKLQLSFPDKKNAVLIQLKIDESGDQ